MHDTDLDDLLDSLDRLRRLLESVRRKALEGDSPDDEEMLALVAAGNAHLAVTQLRPPAPGSPRRRAKDTKRQTPAKVVPIR